MGSRAGIQIARLFGIRILLDYSLIFIFLLVMFSLGISAIPAWHPNWGLGLTWGIAFGAALLFFLSILIHELSHALVARAFQIPVRTITLFLFGGVANIEEEPDTPLREAVMAGVGPATSIALGIGFSIAAGVLLSASGVTASDDPYLLIERAGPLTTLLLWLGPINIILGIFNMLPGFPLDGGRVLRAVLWWITNDLRKATRGATLVGHFIGWALIVTGVVMAFGIYVPLFGVGLVPGLWLAFIGWFLNNAAGLSYRQLLVKDALKEVSVSRLMRRRIPQAVSEHSTVSELVEGYILRSGDPFYPVTRNDQQIGLVWAKDVQRIAESARPETAVSQLLRPWSETLWTRPDENAYAASRRLGQTPRDPMPVLEQDTLVGIFGHEELARWMELQAGRRQAVGSDLARSRP